MSGDRAPRLEKTAELTLPITTHANETRNAYREVDAVRLVESLLVAAGWTCERRPRVALRQPLVATNNLTIMKSKHMCPLLKECAAGTSWQHDRFS